MGAPFGAAPLQASPMASTLGLEHGLSNSYVVSIARDKRGVM